MLHYITLHIKIKNLILLSNTVGCRHDENGWCQVS